VRDTTLHGILEAFTAEAAGELMAETESGAEIPFVVTETEGRPGGAALYCYRPLTGEFIDDRGDLLSALPTYAPAVRALEGHDGLGSYLSERGEARIPGGSRERADAALRSFLSRVFDDRSEFGFDADRFELSYAELERAVYEGRCVSTVIAPLLGVALDAGTAELPLAGGLSLVRGEALADAPSEAVWGTFTPDERGTDEPNVLIVLTSAQERSVRSPVSIARGRFRRVLTALRLFERGGYALGPVAWTRTDTGVWRPVALGSSGRPRLLTFIRADQEDELRAFCNLLARRAPSSGELAWALARFEMGCERLAPFEALTDYLLALRALLEPEGPDSGRLAQRLAVLCARPEEQAALAGRTAQAIALERSVITGLVPPQTGINSLVEEICEHLRALLRDVLCGHLDVDLRTVADELLAESAASHSHR
jgi:hypothetical protein